MDTITIDEAATITVTVDISGDIIVINPVAESAADLLILIAQNSDEIGDLQELHSTSWISGAVISINGTDPSTFDVTAGTGQHVNHSTHPPVITPVVVAAQTGVVVTNLATQTISEIAVDINGNFVQQFTFTPEERRDVFSIGALSHPDLATIINAQNLARVIDHEVVLSIADLALAIGSLTVAGGVVQPNGVNLNINITSATTYVLGINKQSIKDPNYVHSIAIPTITFFKAWQDGVGGFNVAPATDVDPNNYDDTTGGASVPNGTVLPNKWQMLRFYFFPVDGPESSAVILHYGTEVFGTAEEALADLGIDFIPHPTLINAVHRGNIAIKQGATDLSDPTQAIFQTVGKFGHTGGGGAGGAGVTDHELLSGLLGGAANDHQHLTTVELAKLATIEAGATVDQTKTEIDALGLDHESLSGMLGGGASDHQHLTTAELAKLTGIEAGATADQTKADIDALGIDAETLDGFDSTDLEQVADKDATGGYVGMTLFKINFLNALDTFTSFLANANTAARTYTFQDRNGTIADDTDLAGKEDADVDILKADTTDELSVGFTTTVEALASDTITPDFTKQSLKTRTTAGNITINNPSTGQGVMHIVFTIDASGPRTVTYGTEVKPVVGAPTSLTASAVYLMTLVRDTSSHTIVSILEVA